MAPTLRVDDDVYEQLKRHAEPFIDTPNSVLRRLLGLDQEIAAPNGVPTADTEEEEHEPPRPISSGRASSVPQRRRRVSKQSPKRNRVPAGALLPEDAYEAPLLQALNEFGGSAPSRQVIDRVGEILDASLTELDREALSSGGIRWQSRVQFVRLRLIQQGLMVKESGRGVWAISDAGRTFLNEASKKAVGQ